MRSPERSVLAFWLFYLAIAGLILSALALANDIGGLLSLSAFVGCAFLVIFTLE